MAWLLVQRTKARGMCRMHSSHLCTLLGQAIQSYRATMAVLRQQAAFVKQLFDTGVIDDMERAELLRCSACAGRLTP